MAGTPIQSIFKASTTTNSVSVQETYTETPTSGTLLVTALGVDKSSGDIIKPFGWELIDPEYIGSSVSGAWAWKISDGTESLVTWAYATTRARPQMWLAEYSGLDTLDVVASDNSGTSTTQSQSSGTTSITAKADGRAFAIFGADTYTNISGGRSYTNSFVEGLHTTDGSSPALMVAEKELSSLGVQECTFNTTTGGDQMFGKIAVFYLSAITPPTHTFPAQVEDIMNQVFTRVVGTSTQTTSPFTFTAHANSNALADADRGYVIIEQQNDKSIWANVVVTYTATGTVLAINEIEETSETDNTMPTFTGDVNIYSSVPTKQMSHAQEEGRDGILIIGDGNAVGNNGTTLSTTGWSEMLDSVDSNVLTLNLGSLVANATHAGTDTNAEVTDKYLPAAEPLPHVQNVGLFPPANSVSFGIALGKEYFHRRTWARQTVLLPLAKTSSSSFNGGEWTAVTGGLYTATVTAVNTFLSENEHNKLAMIVISLGINDSVAAASAGFEAALDTLINKLRNDAFTANTLQTDFSDVPVVVCGLPDDFITTIGAEATAIELSLSSAPTRLRNIAFANTDVSYLTDTSDYYIDANAQREFAKVIYTAFTNTFTNVVI